MRNLFRTFITVQRIKVIKSDFLKRNLNAENSSSQIRWRADRERKSNKRWRKKEKEGAETICVCTSIFSLSQFQYFSPKNIPMNFGSKTIHRERLTAKKWKILKWIFSIKTYRIIM